MENNDFCVSQNESAKQDSIQRIVRIARKEHWSYEDWRYVSRRVRESLSLKPEAKKGNRIPRLMTAQELTRYLRALQDGGNLQHETMVRLMLATGVRVNELVNIECKNIDLRACKIFLGITKGDKPREVLFPEAMRPILQALIQSDPKRRYLFETIQDKAYSTRRIQQIVAQYGRQAGLEGKIHPHLFRHMALTRLSTQMSDSAVCVLSGHSKGSKALEIYQHLATSDIARQYQEAMRDFV